MDIKPPKPDHFMALGQARLTQAESSAASWGRRPAARTVARLAADVAIVVLVVVAVAPTQSAGAVLGAPRYPTAALHVPVDVGFLPTDVLRGAQAGAIPRHAGVALTPPMGWNGFNHFHLAVTEATVEEEARALVDSGMREAGYRYVNLDGGWDLHQRSTDGSLQSDPRKFPHGIRPVAAYVHSLGLKFGIYTSAGVLNCAGTSAGSYGHYPRDAAMFASWGVDYLKLDWCYIPYRNYPHLTHAQVSRELASQMLTALDQTGRPILYDVNATEDQPWTWAGDLSHLWRTAPDSRDTYGSMLYNFQSNVGWHEYAKPGRWNDPDMLEVGNGGMSLVEYRAQFSLWAEMAAPLIAGNDLVAMSPATRSILTNREVISVDQDPLGVQGYPIASAGGHWVLAKPLADGDRAVVLFNETNRPAVISTTLPQIGFQNQRTCDLIDLWTGEVSEGAGTISSVVPAHGVVMYEVSRAQAGPIPVQ